MLFCLLLVVTWLLGSLVCCLFLCFRHFSICILIHIRSKVEFGLNHPGFFLTVPMRFFLLVMLHVCFCYAVLSASCCHPTSWLSCVLSFLVFCHFSICFLIHIRSKVEFGLNHPVIFSDRSNAVLFVSYISCLSSLCCLLRSLWSPDFLALLCVVFSCVFVTFPYVSWSTSGLRLSLV